MHVELEQFWQTFASRGFVSDSWVLLFILVMSYYCFIKKSICDRWRSN